MRLGPKFKCFCVFVVLLIIESLTVDNFLFPFPISCKQLLSQERKLFDLIHFVSIDFPANHSK